MEVTVYNPQKSRLETIDIEYTAENTTWFSTKRDHDISKITDYDGGLVIGELSHNYPVWIYDISRADIGFNRKKAKQMIKQHL